LDNTLHHGSLMVYSVLMLDVLFCVVGIVWKESTRNWKLRCKILSRGVLTDCRSKSDCFNRGLYQTTTVKSLISQITWYRWKF